MAKKIALVLMLILAIVCCCGCSAMLKASTEQVKNAPMFSTVERFENGMIIVDNETNVMYWMSIGAYNNGTLTLLVNEDGAPKIYNR